MLKKKVIGLALRDRPDAVLIEDKASGMHLLQDLATDGRFPRIAITPTENKVIRAAAVSARIEGRQVYVPAAAPWLDEFQREILAFPDGHFDDQVDSMSQYLNWIADRGMVDAPFVLIESPFARASAHEIGIGGPAPWDLFPTGNY